MSTSTYCRWGRESGNKASHLRCATVNCECPCHTSGAAAIPTPPEAPKEYAQQQFLRPPQERRQTEERSRARAKQRAKEPKVPAPRRPIISHSGEGAETSREIREDSEAEVHTTPQEPLQPPRRRGRPPRRHPVPEIKPDEILGQPEVVHWPSNLRPVICRTCDSLLTILNGEWVHRYQCMHPPDPVSVIEGFWQLQDGWLVAVSGKVLQVQGSKAEVESAFPHARWIEPNWLPEKTLPKKA